MMMVSELISEIANQHKKFKVLIFESDDISELVLSYLLTNIGIGIICTQNSAKTIKTIIDNPDIDLILIDLPMWDINKMETIQKMRQLYKNAVSIALIKPSFNIDKEKALLALFDGHLLKPIKRKELYMLIKKILTRNQKIWTDNSHDEVP